MAVEQQKKDCRKKERKFYHLCEKYDPDNIYWAAVVNFREVWTEEIDEASEDLFDAVDEMLSEHEAELGAPEVAAWKLAVSNANKKFGEIVGKFGKAEEKGISQTIQGSLPVQSNTSEVKAAKVNIEIDNDIVSKESKFLSEEVKKFLDCEKAADEDIAVAMEKVDDWYKRFERIQDKANAIKRNSDCHDVDDHRVSSALCEVENLEQKLNKAVEQLKYETYNGVMVGTIRQLFHVDIVDELTFRGTAEFKVTKIKEFAADLRETKQEQMKDHDGTDGSYGQCGGGSFGGCADQAAIDSDEDFADTDYHSDDYDEEHRQEPGGQEDA